VTQIPHQAGLDNAKPVDPPPCWRVEWCDAAGVRRIRDFSVEHEARAWRELLAAEPPPGPEPGTTSRKTTIGVVDYEREAAKDLVITRALVAALEQQTGYDEADEQVRQGEVALLRRAVDFMERTGKGLPRWAGFSPSQLSTAPAPVRSEIVVDVADDDRDWRVAAGLSSGPPPRPKTAKPRSEAGAQPKPNSSAEAQADLIPARKNNPADFSATGSCAPSVRASRTPRAARIRR
jgi:hypothetical protein